MDKNITSVKDLVIDAITHFSIIKTSADKGDVSSCFKMGMIHLLGIDTAVDFKKAVKYLGNQSLVDNQDANRLLAFIAELEGNFSQAFHYYERTESSEKDSYLDKVIKGRNKLQDYLKKLDLPITVNKDISKILSDYSKGKASKVGACIKVASICNDEVSCLQAAKILYDTKDYISAVKWLQKGNIGFDNTLYDTINKSFEKSRDALLHSKEMKVIDFDGNALLSSDDPTPFLNKVKKACEAESMKSSIEWKDKNKKQIGTLIRIQKEKEEKERLEAVAAEKAKKEKIKKIAIYAVVMIIGFIAGCNGVLKDAEHPELDGIEGGLAVMLEAALICFAIMWYISRKKKNKENKGQ